MLYEVKGLENVTIKRYKKKIFKKKIKVYHIGTNKPDVIPYSKDNISALESIMEEQMIELVKSSKVDLSGHRNKQFELYLKKCELFLKTKQQLIITKDEQERFDFPLVDINLNNIDKYSLKRYYRILEEIQKLRSIIKYDDEKILCKKI